MRASIRLVPAASAAATQQISRALSARCSTLLSRAPTSSRDVVPGSPLPSDAPPRIPQSFCAVFRASRAFPFTAVTTPSPSAAFRRSDRSLVFSMSHSTASIAIKLPYSRCAKAFSLPVAQTWTAALPGRDRGMYGLGGALYVYAKRFRSYHIPSPSARACLSVSVQSLADRGCPAHPHQPFGNVGTTGMAGDLGFVPFAYELLSGGRVPQRLHGKLSAREALLRWSTPGVRWRGIDSAERQHRTIRQSGERLGVHHTHRPLPDRLAGGRWVCPDSEGQHQRHPSSPNL